MLDKFIQSIDQSSLLGLAFELIWDRYTDDDIASVMDIPAWEPIDNALCTVTGQIREEHPERKLTVVLSVVASQSADLEKVEMGTLSTKFREDWQAAVFRGPFTTCEFYYRGSWG